MPSTEVTRLSRRVDRVEEDLRVISDTVLDIKDVVDQHTVVLAEHGTMLVEILRRLEPAAG